MATVSFIDKFKAMKLTKFNFVQFERTITGDENEKVVLFKFTLETPIDKLVSSNFDYHPVTNQVIHPYAENVEVITCKFSDIEKYQADFTFDEDSAGEFTGAGTYHGDMFYDVAKSSNQAWLTDEKFSSKSRKFKNDQRAQRLGKFL